MLYLEVDGVERTNRVQANGSFRHQSNVNQQRDVLSFEVKKSPTDTWYPEIGSDIYVEYDSAPIFGGTITRVAKSVESASLVIYQVEAQDRAFELDRKLVTERYTNEYVSTIIGDLVANYAPTFTTVGVIGDIVITSISFNGIKVSECLEKLAQIVGYAWYVDSDQDIHFFPKNEEPAPFDLTDTSENYVWESLVVADDLSQVRNSILVKGGDIEGNEVTEEFTATGTADERTTYRLAHKFARLPTVLVNSVSQTVGVEFLNADADFDCMWDFQQKYVRFTAGNVPAATDVVEVTGTPLYRLVARLNNPASIAEHGIYEFKIEDSNIRSQDEIRSRAEAEIEAYKNGVTEAQFETYTAGLRSGQVINVNSTLRGVNEDFLIQSVDFQMRSGMGDGVWSVKLATMRTVGIIEFLQRMLRNNGASEGENELLLTFLQYADEAEADDDAPVITTTSPPYLLDTTAKLNLSTLS